MKHWNEIYLFKQKFAILILATLLAFGNIALVLLASKASADDSGLLAELRINRTTAEGGQLLPFDPSEPAATDYSMSVPSGTTQVTLTAETANPTETIVVRYNNGTYPSVLTAGHLEQTLSLAPTAIRLFIDVYNSAGTVQLNRYTVRLTFDMAGDGTTGNPYQIHTAQQLSLIGQSPYSLSSAYKLMNHISLSNFITDDDSIRGWNPIGGEDDFTGSFDGSGKTISGLWSNRVAQQQVGLFGSLGAGASISKLELSADADKGGIVGGNYAGMLAGRSASGGQLSDISVQAAVYAGGPTGYAGGIVGYNGAAISRSSVTGTVYGIYVVGGLAGELVGGASLDSSFSQATVYSLGSGANGTGGAVGYVMDGRISDTFATGNVSTAYGHAGGLVGYASAATTIEQSYAAAVVSIDPGGAGSHGGLIGQKADSGVTVTGSYWDMTASGQPGSAGDSETGKNTDEMQTRETYAGWDWAATWLQQPGHYPHLQWTAPGSRPTGLTLTGADHIAENVPIGTTVGMLDAIDPDLGDALTYSFVSANIDSGLNASVDDDNASFVIDGEALKTNAAVDYETKNVYHVLIAVTDSTYRMFWMPFTINVQDMGGVTLSANTVEENAPAGTAIGTVTIVDPDSYDSSSLALVTGVGDNDNANFEMDGNILRTKASFDYETKNSYHIRIGITDSVYQTVYAAYPFSVFVTNVNDVPIVDFNLSYVLKEKTSPGTEIGNFSTIIVEQGDQYVYSLVGGSGDTDNGSFSIDGNKLKSAAMFDYETKSTYQIRVSVTDGVYSLQKPFTILVENVEEDDSPPPPGTNPPPGPLPGPSLTPTPTPTPSPTPEAKPLAVVSINGDTDEQLATVDVREDGGRKTIAVTLDPDKIAARLTAAGDSPEITIPVSAEADEVIGAINGQTAKLLAEKQATLVVETDAASYKLPVGQLGLGDLLKQWGASVDLADVVVQVQIGDSTEKQAALLKQAAGDQTFTPVVGPVNFTVTVSYKGKSTEIKLFPAYVEREIKLPDDVDPAQVTTAIVLHDDGTVTPVPTVVELRNGRYYARVSSLTNSAYAVIGYSHSFADMKGHWAQSQVSDMASRLIVDGVSDTAFEPERPITRAEFAAILVRALGLPADGGKPPFADVPAGAWYAGAAASAAAYGLIGGYEDGTFRPDQPISRQEAFTMLGAALKLAGQQTDGGNADKTLAAFADRASVADWALAGTAALVNAGIIDGRASGLAPLASISRAEAAVAIQRLLIRTDLIDAPTPASK
ncbi:S-layer homology domain-containing protein [Paenibacillus cymbidii]|uniref:S-layer homology domain-containing protein n=1 Tax=Paenibacillus cymbidii TaxID=1639034 RepID=UPI00107FE7A7|nr:S-layer homology domain-containing protein [Paenibacillus cymbidii]